MDTTITVPPTSGLPDEARAASTPPPASEQPTQQLSAPLVGAAHQRDRCPVCASPLAPDQRYCVDCGQRLSAAKPPFLDGGHAPARAPATTAAVVVPARSAVPRGLAAMSANNTLIAGVATLLLAMGIGVLIGKSGQGAGARRQPAQVITVAGGAGAAAAAPAATTTTAAATPSTSAASKVGAKPSKAATAPPAPVVKIGAKGSGPGYQHGKFTGNFFGN